MHKNNPHNQSYDMSALCAALPELTPHIIEGQRGQQTLDFSDGQAIKALNKAILKKDYRIDFWDLPDGYLCPPIPGRVDYLYHLKDLITQPTDRAVSALDIGTGANLIYAIVGSRAFNWRFVASEIDSMAVNCAKQLVKVNKGLSKQIKVRHQSDENSIFANIIHSEDYFDVSLCNPPFHRSQEEAAQGNQRKNKNLNYNKSKRGSTLKPHKKDQLNFAGTHKELWCEGGEQAFIKKMIEQSVAVKEQVGLFTCLVSRKEHLPAIYKTLKSVNATMVKTVDMAQGSKVSRFVAWSFFSE
ncbi:MAG: 23S rRNA (adenine(1618)-N(6))-methyltransferase RlmF [Bermanella sp.]|jgi:Predicted SAM-dependent methyltransferase